MGVRSVSAVATRSFDGRAIASASSVDALDRSHDRRLRTTTLPANGSRGLEAITQLPTMGPTLIACASLWLRDFSSRGRAGDAEHSRHFHHSHGAVVR
jgi:hypothetical protein